MTLLVTDDITEQSCEATGHPTECQEPAPGTVQNSDNGITVNAADGSESSLATRASTLHFDSHSHAYTTDLGCHSNSAHDLTGSDFNDANLSQGITVNNEPVLLVASDVATDPGTGSPVNIVSENVNNGINEI